MSKLAVPNTPTNLRFPAGTRITQVESDVYNICNRIGEISPRLYINLVQRTDEYVFVVMEMCTDGIDRMVFKVKELDNRLLVDLRKIMSVPLAKRVEILDKQNHQLEKEWKEEQLDDLYERVGRPMWTQLEHDGFIQRGVSYPKKGIKPS